MANKKRIIWDPCISSNSTITLDKLRSDLEGLGYTVISIRPGIIQEELTDDESQKHWVSKGEKE